MTKRNIPKPYKIALYFPRQDKEKKITAKYQKVNLLSFWEYAWRNLKKK